MGWIIAAAVVLLIVLLLCGRVAVYFDYNNTLESALECKVKYLCFNIMKIPKAKKAKKSKKEKKPPKGKKESEESKKKSKKDSKKKSGKKKKKIDLKALSFDDKIALLKLALSGIGKPLKKLLKRVEFSHMSVEIVCGGDDAAKAAIKFGAMNIAVGNLLGLLDSFFTLRELDDMNITVDFQSEKTVYSAYFEVRMSLFAGIAGAFGLLRAFLKVMKAYDQKSKQKSKNA